MNIQDAHVKVFKKIANSIARSYGYGSATKIVRVKKTKL